MVTAHWPHVSHNLPQKATAKWIGKKESRGSGKREIQSKEIHQESALSTPGRSKEVKLPTEV